MNTQIQEFKFQTSAIRVQTDERGNPLFCGKDVCEVLGYANHNDTIKKLCKADGVSNSYPIIDSMGREQYPLFITEGNLYRLIIKSNKPEAEPFEAWVCDEVLPTIRKTGGYSVQSQQLLNQLNEKDQLLISSLQAQIQFLQEQLATAQRTASGAMRMYEEEIAYTLRLKRARGKVTIVERRDIFDLLDNGQDVAYIANWSGRSRDMIKKIIAGGRYA